MSDTAETYRHEDIREFAVRRPWLHRDGALLSQDEYDGLKARTATLSEARANYLMAFIDGWKASRA